MCVCLPFPPFILRVGVLAARGVCRCVCRGEVTQQLEWVLLDAHFALLQCCIQQRQGTGTLGQGQCQGKPSPERQALVAKRCQALTALIRLSSIAPCRELMDMQEKVRPYRWESSDTISSSPLLHSRVVVIHISVSGGEAVRRGSHFKQMR